MDDKKQIYECGTLRYTLTGVVVAAGLIMLGFFSYNIATYAVTSAVPLRLKELGASNTLMVLIVVMISTISVLLAPSSAAPERTRCQQYADGADHDHDRYDIQHDHLSGSKFPQ